MGFYPATPAPLSVADEATNRRYERLRTQPSRARTKHPPDRLKDGPEGRTLVEHLNPSELPSSKRNGLEPDTKDIAQDNQSSHVVDRNGLDPSRKGKEREILPSRRTDHQRIDPETRTVRSTPNQVSSGPTGSSSPVPNYLNGYQDRTEVLNQTVINSDTTRISSVPTPHPPGWCVFDSKPQSLPTTQTSPRRPTKPGRRKIVSSSSSKMTGSNQASSSAPEDRVIFASQAARPPSKNPPPGLPTYRHDPLRSHYHSGEVFSTVNSNHQSSTVANRENHAVDDLTPRPSKRRLDQDSQNQFSSPSFEGLNQDGHGLLTSTPAVRGAGSSKSHPSLHSLDDPSPVKGPRKTLKNLAATVIEFLVDKSPVESLSDLFSTNQLDKKTILDRRLEDKRQKEHQEQLERLLKSSNLIERDRLSIQSRLDQLPLPPNRFLSLLPFRILNQIFISSRRTNNSKMPSGDPGLGFVTRTMSWKSVVRLFLKSYVVWLVFNLVTIRTYNYFIQTTAGLQSSSTMMIPITATTNVYYLRSHSKFGWLGSMTLNVSDPQHRRDDGQLQDDMGNSNEPGGNLTSTRRIAADDDPTTRTMEWGSHRRHLRRREEQQRWSDYFEGSMELIEFFTDWTLGFKMYFDYQRNLLSLGPTNTLDFPLDSPHLPSSSSSSHFIRRRWLDEWYNPPPSSEDDNRPSNPSLLELEDLQFFSLPPFLVPT